jgi:hypothetical protein
MTIDTFQQLLHLVGHRIAGKDTRFKRALCPQRRLSLTLCYLPLSSCKHVCLSIFARACPFCVSASSTV